MLTACIQYHKLNIQALLYNWRSVESFFLKPRIAPSPAMNNKTFPLITLLFLSAFSSTHAQGRPTNDLQIWLGLGYINPESVNDLIQDEMSDFISITGSDAMHAAAFFGIGQSFQVKDNFYLQPEYMWSQGYKRFEEIGGGLEDWIVYTFTRNTGGLMIGYLIPESPVHIECGPTYSWLKFKENKTNTPGLKATVNYTTLLNRVGWDFYLSGEYCKAETNFTELNFNNINLGMKFRLPISK